MSTNPFSFDAVDSGSSRSSIDQNAAGALAKIQDDSRPMTTLIQQAEEQNPRPTTTMIQQAAEQNPRPTTTMIQQAAEQNPRPTTTLVQQAAEQNPRPTTTLVQQAAEQNPRPTTTLVQQAAEQNPRPTTTLVQQAAEQNSADNVVRAVEKTSPENFKCFDDVGIHKFFSQDLESNLIDNASQVLARGNAKEMLANKPKSFTVGTVGELQGLDPKDFWHSNNDKADLSKYVSQDRTAAKQESESVGRAIAALEKQIDQNLKDSKTGKPLDAEQRDRMRQMAENAAMIKLGVAEERQPTDPKAAKNLVSGAGHSVNDLIRIAKDHGANQDNVDQLKKMVEQFEKR